MKGYKNNFKIIFLVGLAIRLSSRGESNTTTGGIILGSIPVMSVGGVVRCDTPDIKRGVQVTPTLYPPLN